MSANESILFSAADLLFSADASDVHCIHDALPVIQKVAGTKPWFVGLGVVEGRLMPVSDLSLYFGRASSSGCVIELAHEHGVFGLRVDEVHAVSQSEPDSNYQYIDLAQLVQSDKFLNIECETA